MKLIYKHLPKLATAFFALSVSFSSFAQYKLPEYQKLTLDNGLTIYLMEQHEVPMIDVNLVVKAGAINDANKPGLNALTLANMELGTTQQSKADIDEALDFIGARLRTSAGAEISRVTASFAAKDQAKVLGILRDMVISPRFEKVEFEKHKSRYLVQLEQEKEVPSSVIGTYFNKMIFGEQGYGSASQGNTNSIKAISLEQLKAFHNNWYRPQNSAIAIAGDFDSKAMLIRLKALFSGWEQGQLPSHKAPNKAKNFKQSNVLLVNKGDARETRFMIGAAGVNRSNPDYVAVTVINTILGGRFTSWLNDALRVNAGLTYGARSRFDTFSNSGSFAISTFTKTSTTIEAIDLALATYNKLFAQGIDEKTLNSAKAYVKGQFPPRYETSTQLARLMGSMFGLGFDERFINTFEQQVNSLTVDNAKTIINQYFPKDNLQFVLIGQAEQIKDKVAKYGKLKELDIKDMGFKVN